MLSTPSDGWDDGPSLLASLWRYRWLVVAAGLLGAFAGYGLSLRQPPQYEATASVLLSGPSQNAGSGGGGAPAMDPDRYMGNQAQFMASSQVVARAAEISGLPPATWRSTLNIRPLKDLDVIVVRVRASTGKNAAKVANSVVEAYQEVRSKRARAENRAAEARLKAIMDELRAELADLDAKLQGSEAGDPVLRARRDAAEGQLKAVVNQDVQASVAARLTDSSIQFTEKAWPPSQPVEPRPRRTAAAGAVFSLFAASALTWLLERRRQQAHQAATDDETGPQPAAPARLPGDSVPVLGVIPDFTEIDVEGPAPAATAPQSLAAKGYQTVAQLLEFGAREAEFQVVLVTSPEPGDGKSTTALNLAIAAGQDEQGVLVVDADLRRGGLSELCHVNGRAGLSDMVHRKGDMSSGQYLWMVAFPGIRVIPGGSHVGDPTSLLSAPFFGSVMSTIRQHGTLVLIDSPALSEGPDALEIGKHADAAIVVVSPRATLGVLWGARKRLDLAGIPVLGYVVNGEASPEQVKRQTNGSSPFGKHTLRPAADGGIGRMREPPL